MAALDDLVIGDIVELQKDKKGYKAKAEIKFIGSIDTKQGIFYGVAVDKIWKGKHNGTFRQMKYFETDQQRGLFVTIDKVTKVIEASKNDKRILMNDRISVIKLGCNGTVRFIGITGFKPGIFYGIELDEAKGKNNGTMKGRKFFECGNNFGIFCKLKEIEPSQAQNKNIGMPPPPPPSNVNGMSGLPPPNPLQNGLPKRNDFKPPNPPKIKAQKKSNNKKKKNALNNLASDEQKKNDKKVVKKWPSVQVKPVAKKQGSKPPKPPNQKLKKNEKKAPVKAAVKNEKKNQKQVKKWPPVQQKKQAFKPPSPPRKKSIKKVKKVKKAVKASNEMSPPPIKDIAPPQQQPQQQEENDFAPGMNPGMDLGMAMNENDEMKEEEYDYTMEPGYTPQGISESVIPSQPQIQPQVIQAQPPSSSPMMSGFAQQPMIPPQQQSLAMMPDMMTMQQNIMKMQQDIINNPQLATQKWASPVVSDDEIEIAAANKSEQSLREHSSVFNMFGNEYFKIEGMLRIFGCDDDACKYYINRMRANNLRDSNLMLLDTINDIALFKKIFPIEEEIRNRFRCWIRYDIQGYVASFKQDMNAKDALPGIKRKKSMFARAKSVSKVKESEKDKDEIVHFNISGFVYSTLKSTINGSGSNMLKKMIKHKFDQKKLSKKENLMFDENGFYFVNNRNGELFEAILSYLQCGKLVINFDKFSLEQMKKEFKFFHIPFPENEHKFMPDSFRFEYVLGAYYYNVQAMKYEFTACDMRIVGVNKKTESLINKCAGIEWKEEMNDIELFLMNRRKFKDLGFRIVESSTFKCDDKEHSNWTVVEYYQKYIFCKKK